MPNRSKSTLPSHYAPVMSNWLGTPGREPDALDIFDITQLHFHSNLELGYCFSGRGSCIVEEKEFSYSAGDAQVIFPFQRHLNRSEGGERSRWLWMNLDPLMLLSAWGAPDLARLERLWDTSMGLYGVISRERYPLIAELIARLIQVEDEKRRLSCLCTLIEELAGESQQLPRLKLKSSHQFDRLSPALSMVEQALSQGELPRVSRMAEACALSPAPFRRAFHQVMGQSPQQYIHTCQMKKAQQLLLLTDTPITQIAFSVGYQDVSGFNRQFMATFGLSPRAYRKQSDE